jgi:NADPH-dependent 2,4-dienoyl-CoA reductase/sulfur reductase-like enzyme
VEPHCSPTRGLRTSGSSSAARLGASFEPNTLELAFDDNHVDQVQAETIILATGAYDRPVPLPGWTLPGVFTVGGAQALLKSQGLLVGRRILLAGVGPLLLVVASQLHAAGAEVVAVVEPVPLGRIVPFIPGLLREWRLTRQGLRYRLSLFRGGVPWLASTMLVEIHGSDQVEGATVRPVDRDWRSNGPARTFEVDAVCLGYGLLPSTELARMCGCGIEFSSSLRGWVPIRSSAMESTVPGVFIAGDCAGIAGALCAAEEGRIAGISAAEQLGLLPQETAKRRRRPHQARRARLEHVRRAFDQAYALRPGLFETATPETIVCRCEEVSLLEMEAALADQAHEAGQLRSYTRCGMGACQGRMCGSAVTEWLATRSGRTLQDIGPPAIGLPAKPVVTLGALAETPARLTRG